MSKTDKVYSSTFCNKAHRLADGKPIGHECYVLPTTMLHAEAVGNWELAKTVAAAWNNRKRHNGLKQNSSKFNKDSGE